jgi:hypothetical protein
MPVCCDALQVVLGYGKNVRDRSLFLRTGMLCRSLCRVARGVQVPYPWRSMEDLCLPRGWEFRGDIEDMRSSRTVLQTVLKEIDHEVSNEELELACYVIDSSLQLAREAENQQRFLRVLVCSALVLARKLLPPPHLRGQKLRLFASKMGLRFNSFKACERTVLAEVDWYVPQHLGVDCVHALALRAGWSVHDPRVFQAELYVADLHCYGWTWSGEATASPPPAALALAALERSFRDAGTPLPAAAVECGGCPALDVARTQLREMLDEHVEPD